MSKAITDVHQLTARRKRHRFAYVATLVFLGLIAFLVVLLLVVMRTPMLRVREVKIEGLTRIPEEDVRAFLSARVPEGWLGHFFGARAIFVWPDGFPKEGLVFLPEAEEIRIEKEYLERRVVISVREAEREGIWCFRKSEVKCFWFDKSGKPIRRIPGTYGNLLPVVQDYARDGVPAGEPFLEERLFKNMLSILETLKRADLNVRELRVEDLRMEEAKITTDGPLVLLSLRFPAPDLEAALQGVKTKVPLSSLQYLDFRVERRVYYK